MTQTFTIDIIVEGTYCSDNCDHFANGSVFVNDEDFVAEEGIKYRFCSLFKTNLKRAYFFYKRCDSCLKYTPNYSYK